MAGPKVAEALSATMETTDAPQIIEHVNKGVTFTPTDALWVPSSARFVTLGQYARGSGTIQVWEMSVGEVKKVQESEKKEAIKCGTFGASSFDDRHIAVGDYGGALNIWDLERMDAPVFSTQAHELIINDIDGCGGLGIGGGAPELVTGSRDGAVRVWDPRVKEAVMAMEPAAGEAARDCWTVAFGNSFSDEERCIAAGYDNGDVKVFDLRTSTLRWEGNASNGVVSVEFDRKDIEMNKLLCTTLESKFKLYDCRTQHPEEGFASLAEKAHKSTVWMGRHLPQNRDLFITTGGNGGINLYKYTYPRARQVKDAEGRLKGNMGKVELLNARVVSTQPCVGWDWSMDKEGLAVGAFLDQTIRVFIVTKLDKY